MPILLIVFLIIVFIVLPGLRVVKQYQKGVVFRFGRIVGIREPGLNMIIPYFEQIRRIDLRTITLPIPPQKIITKDNVSVDVSAVAYYKVVDAEKSLVSIENVMVAIDQ